MRRRDRARREDAFTLIDLMFVVLIIGILIAIALPTFLGARQRGQDKQAQSALRIAHAAARVCYTQFDTFNDPGPPPTPCSGGQMTQEEPTLTYYDGATDSTSPRIISIDVVNDIA